MPDITVTCDFTDCEYSATAASDVLAAAKLYSHIATHTASSGGTSSAGAPKAPPIDRPELRQDIKEQEWQTFVAEWKCIKDYDKLKGKDINNQLHNCCEKELRKLLLKENEGICDGTEEDLLLAMKHMSVLGVAVSVRRTELMGLRQQHGQSV